MQAQQITSKRDSIVAGVAVSANDTATFQCTRCLFVGSGGNLAVVHPTLPDGTGNSNSTVTTYINAPAGYHPLQVVAVMATGTSANNFVACY